MNVGVSISQHESLEVNLFDQRETADVIIRYEYERVGIRVY